MGMAVGQTITSTASPLPVIRAKQGEPDWDQLDEVVRQWKPAAIIVGMPYNMDGTENDMTEKAETFREKLQEKYQLPCHGMDERLSTREARNISRENAQVARKKFDERGDVDSLAAQLILESWFEQQN